MSSRLKSISLACFLALALSLALGCATSTPQTELPPTVEQQRITDLSLAIRSLRDDIDPAEARRAARIAIEYSRQLAQEYEVSSSPVMHNFLVNIGVKEKGLCVDWTNDLLVRLQQERFYSLKLHWGIANYQSAFRLEHSTVIISARGDSLDNGLVLDPWRYSGDLFWAATRADPSYQWYPQADIHALKREHKLASSKRRY